LSYIFSKMLAEFGSMIADAILTRPRRGSRSLARLHGLPVQVTHTGGGIDDGAGDAGVFSCGVKACHIGEDCLLEIE